MPAGLQVLRSAFSGVRIHDDVTSLDRLPEVGERVGGQQAAKGAIPPFFCIMHEPLLAMHETCL